jgi:hypothetical protein
MGRVSNSCPAAYDTTQTNLRIESLRPLLFLESDLDQTQLERMAKTMTPVAMLPGTTIFAQGDKCATMYYITQGQLSFFRKPSNGRIKATAIALQKQFDMEERTNALEAAKHSMSAAAACSPEANLSDTRRHVTAAERRNAFLEMSVLMDIGNIRSFVADSNKCQRCIILFQVTPPPAPPPPPPPPCRRSARRPHSFTDQGQEDCPWEEAAVCGAARRLRLATGRRGRRQRQHEQQWSSYVGGHG